MSVQVDPQFEKNIGDFYGKYLGTFESEGHQVKAYLFAQGAGMVAHVSFQQGVDSDNVTDPYLSELQSFARQKGFDGKLRLLFS